MTTSEWHPRMYRPTPQTTIVSFIDGDTTRMKLDQFLDLLEKDEGFRTHFTKSLLRAQPGAVFFELPAMREGQLGAELECALTKAPALEKIKANPKAFKEHFEGTEEPVVVFPNLEADATLVVPCPTADLSRGAHLFAFLSRAKSPQIHALWMAVARTARAAIGPAPLWISTSGTGVPWLHVRISGTPKYYTYIPFSRG